MFLNSYCSTLTIYCINVFSIIYSCFIYFSYIISEYSTLFIYIICINICGLSVSNYFGSFNKDVQINVITKTWIQHCVLKFDSAISFIYFTCSIIYSTLFFVLNLDGWVTWLHNKTYYFLIFHFDCKFISILAHQ